MEEDELDVISADDAIAQLSSIDALIIEARNKKDTTDMQKLEEISKLIETRNKLVDKLHEAKSSEFKEFVESLNLKALHVQPFYVTNRKCRLGSEFEPYDVITKPPQKKKMFSKPPPCHPDQQLNFDIITKRKKDAEKELLKYTKKPILSPQDHAHKLRLEAEISVYNQFLNQ